MRITYWSSDVCSSDLADLLRRYDRPGPRYTSYPTAPQFAASFGEAQFREVARASNEDPIPRRLSLYVHVPFCVSPCFYCGCNRIITRSEEHTSELQSLMRISYAVFCLKKKKTTYKIQKITNEYQIVNVQVDRLHR